MCCEKTNIWDVNIDNIVIWKLVKTKTNSKYLTWCLDKVIRLLILLMPKCLKCVDMLRHLKLTMKIKIKK